MADLLCGSLFENVRREDTRVAGPNRSTSLKRTVVLLTLIGIGATVTFGVQAGMRAKAHRQVKAELEDFRHQLDVGSFKNVAQMLPQLQEKLEIAGDTQSHRGLLIRAQAVLFRFYDASPKRALEIRSAIKNSPAEDPDMLVARALLASPVDRIAMLDDLSKLQKDAEAAFLSATAFDRAKDRAAAEEAYERAETLEPAHPARLVHIAHRLIDNRDPSAQDVIDEMRDIDPNSVWLSLIERELSGTSSSTPGQTPLEIPPVAHALSLVRASITALDKGSPSGSKLEEAARTIHHQMPFMLDYVDMLLAKNHTQAAQRLVELSDAKAWTSDGAKAAKARIALRLTDKVRGRAALEKLLERARDPEVAIDYINELQSATIAPSLLKNLRALGARWPNNEALTAAVSKLGVPKSERRKLKRKKRRRKRRRKR